MRFAVLVDPQLLTKAGSLQDFSRCFAHVLGGHAIIHPISLADLAQGKLNTRQYDVVILPGILGDDSQYPDMLEPHGNHALRQFIADGGHYFGFCAGAYHASSAITYDAPWHTLKKRDAGLLATFSGATSGPLLPYVSPPNTPLTMPTIILKNGTTLRMPYGNGPLFHTDKTPQNIDILARFANIPGEPAAIISYPFGKGHCVLFSALPNYVVDWDPHNNHAVDIDTLQMLHIMHQEFDKTKIFWRDLFASLQQQKKPACHNRI